MNKITILDTELKVGDVVSVEREFHHKNENSLYVGFVFGYCHETVYSLQKMEAVGCQMLILSRTITSDTAQHSDQIKIPISDIICIQKQCYEQN